jgi:hypothetical protein
MDLFLVPPAIVATDYLSPDEAAKTASTRLTSPPGYWADEVAQSLVRDHPYIPADRLVVTFKKRDEADGSAYGFASVTGSPRLSIPVVIKQRQLAPMDVMIVRSSAGDDTEEGTGDMTEDEVVPLNDDTFNKAMEVGQVGDVMGPQEDRTSGYSEDGSSLRLPFRGRTVVAEYLGATPAKLAEFEAALTDKNVLAGFVYNGTGDVVNSWLSAGEPRKTAQRAFLSTPVVAKPVQYVDEIPVTVKTSEFLAADIVADDGSIKTAVAADVVDLTAPEKGKSRILLFEDGKYSSAPEQVCAVSIDDKKTNDVIEKIAAKDLRRGGYYMFQLGDHFTAPAKLSSVQVNEQQSMVKLSMHNPLAKQFELILDRRVKVASLVDDTWVVPMTTLAFQVEGSTEPPMAIEKIAEYLDRRLPDTLTAQDGQYTLNIRGTTFGQPQVDREKIAEVLSFWVTNYDELIKSAEANGSVRFSSTIPNQVEAVTKLASVYTTELPALAKAAISELSIPMNKAVKLAAALADPQSVDSVLSAGFLTEDNLAEFSGLSDQFDLAVSKLARLLLAIRMGFPGDENATVVAMKSLSRVSDRLREASSDARISG